MAAMAPLTFDKELAEALCGIQLPKFVRFSPNGKQIVYQTGLLFGPHRKGKHHATTIWLASASEANSARPLTSGETDDLQPVWFPEGDRIAFLSDRAKPGSGHAIWAMRLDGGDAVQVSPATSKASIDAFHLSPDGKFIAYTSADELSKEEEEREERGVPGPNVWGENVKHSRLRLLNLDTNEVKTLVQGDQHVDQFCWSADGKSIAFVAIENSDIDEPAWSGSGIRTVEVESGNVMELYRELVYIEGMAFDANGTLYFIGSSGKTHFSGYALYSLDPAIPSQTPVSVLSSDDKDGKTLQVAGNTTLVSFDIRSGVMISDATGRELFQRPTEVSAWDAHFDVEDNTWTFAAAMSDPSHPFELFVAKEGQPDVQLSQHGKAVEGRSFGSLTVLTCQSSDGLEELDGLFVTPTSRADKNGKPREALPTVVLIHGGPNSRDLAQFGSTFYWAEYLLSQGYAILYPQYRGSHGRGTRFASYTLDECGKGVYDDIISITDNAAKKGLANADKLLVAGWSNGGLNTYLCSVRNGLHGLGWRFKAAVAGAGMCDLDSLALSSDCGSHVFSVFVGGVTPWTVPKEQVRGRQASALWEVHHAVEEAKRTGEMVIPPMLILHGESDARTPFTQAQGFRRALRTHGLPCEFVAYPGQPHSIARDEYWLDMLERVSRWCHLYIGPGSE